MKKFVAWLIDTAKWFAVCAILVGILIAMMIFLPPARAEEVRTAFLTSFDLGASSFIVTDEDGYTWEFSLREAEYHLGDEYTLHIPKDADPWYEESDENVTFPDILFIVLGSAISFMGFAAIFIVANSIDRS